MPNSTSHQISLLLDRWNHGDKLALEQLMPLVYDELRRMARGALRRQPAGHTLQTTELLHETYLKLIGKDEHGWKNRAHFFGVAATAMRHILVDYARSKVAQKRGGALERLSLTDNTADTGIVSEQVVALEDALKMLADLDERKCRIVKLKFYGGLTNEEAAEALDISVETVKRDWRFARAWLLRELDMSSS
ncbi:MAG: sigma-70 family RNA polymerase sigma factor [Pyrinomonadaceae bacterium]